MTSQGLPAQEVATAREDLKQDLDEATLLPIFLGRAPTRMQAAIDMIADGSVKAEHFFHDHPFLTEIDPMTGKQISQTVSLLDELIEFNKSSLPNLSPFAEGLSRKSKQPEEQLLDDFDIIGSVLSACRSNRADPSVRQSVNDPGLIARSWGAFAKRLMVLQLRRCPASLGVSFLRGLDELEGLPPSRARAASASDFARSVHILNIDEQCKAFKRTVRIILSTPDTDLICNVASSLEHLDPRNASSCASYLMNNARTSNAFHALPKAIGKAVGKTGMQIEMWFDRGVLSIKLRGILQARPVLDL